MINARISKLQAYINSTDWYVIRYADTGQAILLDVRADRQAGGTGEIDALREELGEVGNVGKVRNFPYTTHLGLNPIARKGADFICSIRRF